MGYDLTDNLYVFLHSEEESEDEVDEDEYALQQLQVIEEQERTIQELKEENVRLRQQIESMEKLIKQNDERLALLAKFADRVLGEERAHFVLPEAFQSIMHPEETTLQFLRRLALEFVEHKMSGFDETDHQIHTDRDDITKRIGMFLAEQERIDLETDKEAKDV